MLAILGQALNVCLKTRAQIENLAIQVWLVHKIDFSPSWFLERLIFSLKHLFKESFLPQEGFGAPIKVKDHISDFWQLVEYILLIGLLPLEVLLELFK
jgi:hypothetical protein